jgi:hypothetical protein
MRHKKDEQSVQRVQVTFTTDQWNIINKFRGIMGSGDAELVRNIVLTWLSEKSMVSTTVKNQERRGLYHE